MAQVDLPASNDQGDSMVIKMSRLIDWPAEEIVVDSSIKHGS